MSTRTMSLREEIRDLAHQHLEDCDTQSDPASLLRRLERKLQRQDRRLRAQEQLLHQYANGMQKAANAETENLVAMSELMQEE